MDGVRYVMALVILCALKIICCVIQPLFCYLLLTDVTDVYKYKYISHCGSVVHACSILCMVVYPKMYI